MKVFVIIPAFNEQEKIGAIVSEVSQVCREVVVVDDGSDDNTSENAERAGALVLCHLINRGQGAALKTGILFALKNGAEAIVTFDADGQHSVDNIIDLLTPIQEGRAEIVLGSRFLEETAINIPSTRRAMLKLAVSFTKIMSGLSVTDTHNGLRAFTASAARRMQLRQDRMAHASEILDEINRNRLRYVEVPVTIHYSQYSMQKGQNSLAFGKILFKYLLGRFIK